MVEQGHSYSDGAELYTARTWLVEADGRVACDCRIETVPVPYAVFSTLSDDDDVLGIDGGGESSSSTSPTSSTLRAWPYFSLQGLYLYWSCLRFCRFTYRVVFSPWSILIDVAKAHDSRGPLHTEPEDNLFLIFCRKRGYDNVSSTTNPMCPI